MSQFNLHPWIDIRVAIVMALVLFLVFGYLEWIKSVGFKVVRLLALTLVILVILIFVLNPTYTSSIFTKPIMVLTEGYSQQQADSLQSLAQLEVVDLSNKNENGYRDLARLKGQVKYVLGNGLPESLLTQPGFEFSYLPGDLPTGLIELTIPKFKAGISSKLIGKLKSENETVIALKGPGYQDSILLEPGIRHFQLNIKPKMAGRFTYDLTIKSGEDEIQKETIPIEVLEPGKLNILFLQTYPTFETRYLKNYLEEDGHSILLRYETSKNIFRYETSNSLPLNSLLNITTEKLNPFDLVIISEDVVNQLSPSTQETLLTSIEEGLGVLILLNDGKLPSKFRNAVKLKPTKVNYDSIDVSLSDKSYRIKLLSTRSRIDANPEYTSIFEDKNGSVIGFQNYGKGRIGFQLLQNTYQLRLEGKNNYYQEIWNALLENTAKPDPLSFEIKLRSRLPYFIDKPVNIEIVSNENIPELFYQSELVPLIEHRSIPKQFQATIWPKETGWNKLTLSDSTLLNFYVHPSVGLQSLSIANQVRSNQAHDSEVDLNISQSRTINKKISPLILFILFLISYGFLWLAPKI